MNGSKIRWLLPDDKYIENQVSNIAGFLPLLQMVNVVSYKALSYKVTHIELILDDEMYIAVVLEEVV
ncbi:hypothetical protein Elgi_31710 [Paenibacillus elgii]|uniref:hypothetical protein n=1 Tax=Paenibacillus elgii TaxID=189691 RepID=UPI002D7CE07D|nr:hypothetical protein Elgi_31710 [Paenibacillus elgii]